MLFRSTWPSAVATGETAALNMMGDAVRPVPYLNMNSVEIAGEPIVSAGNIFPDEAGTAFCEEADGCYRVLTFDKDKRLTGFLQMGKIFGSGVYVNAVRERLQFEELPASLEACGADFMKLRNISAFSL